MNAPEVVVQGLSRHYGNVAALDNVSFTVPGGTIVGLLGRNGAGKTTLMGHITGQVAAQSGSVLVGGKNPFENSDVQDSLSFIRDNQRYPDDYKLVHAIRAAKNFHPNWDDDLAEELIETFRLPRTKPVVKKFSRGQLSALGIVIGLASNAPLSIFDEPYLGLDATARQKFYDVLIREFQKNERTVFLSTHLIDEMAPILSHVIVLEKGKKIFDGSAEEAGNLAYAAVGIADAVQKFSVGKTLLTKHQIGTLASYTFSGPLTAELKDEAKLAGIEVSAATLQQAVSALGAGNEDEFAVDSVAGGNR